MTTPTLFSDVAGTAVNNFGAKQEPQGVLSQRAVINIPAATGAGINIGMIRFEEGFRPVSFLLYSDDLDTGSSFSIDVGYLYDDTTGEDDDAFYTNLNIVQSAGNRHWPSTGSIATGDFEATGGGYLSFTTSGTSTTAGDITMVVNFTYDS